MKERIIKTNMISPEQCYQRNLRREKEKSMEYLMGLGKQPIVTGKQIGRAHV